MAKRLTEEILKRHPRPKAGQLLVWDDLVRGFGVRLTPTQTSFVIQWRTSDGRKPRESLKRWPACTVEEARGLARRRLSEVVANKETGADLPLRLAMRSWYEREGLHGRWRPRYRAKVASIIACYYEGIDNSRVNLTPMARKGVEALGRKSVGALTRSDVLAVADHIKPGAAEQFMAIGSSAYGAFFEREWTVGNPFRNRLRVTGGRRIRRRALDDGDFLELWRAFEKEGDPACAAFAVLAFTGARRREVTQMRWGELDLKAATWTLPPERRKTGRQDPEPFVVHLHTAAVAIIKRQPILEGSPFVFWGRRDKRPFDFQHYQIDRLRASVNVKDWRLHDLRRFMRSGLGRLKIPQAVAELCLGHISGGLVKVYDQHRYVEEKREAWHRWGDYLSGLVR